MQNKIEHLRNHLFATLEALRDKENPMDIERAKAISNVANSIIETAKVEVKYLDLVGGKGTGFMADSPALPAPPERPRLLNGKTAS
jgi:hypothetical protein